MFRTARIKKINVNYKDAILEWIRLERPLTEYQGDSESYNKLLSNIKRKNG
jgi:hypothetical protein